MWPSPGCRGSGCGRSRRGGVPSRAAGIENVVVGRPEAVREEAFPEVQRDPLDRGEFGRVRRQEQRREVGRDGELPGDVPAGPVNQDHGVGAGADRLGEFVKHHLHGGGGNRRRNQGDAGIARRADGAEQVGRLVAEITGAARAHPLLVPAPTPGRSGRPALRPRPAHRWRRQIESGAGEVDYRPCGAGRRDGRVCMPAASAHLPGARHCGSDPARPAARWLRLAEVLGNGPLAWEDQRENWASAIDTDLFSGGARLRSSVVALSTRRAAAAESPHARSRGRTGGSGAEANGQEQKSEPACPICARKQPWCGCRGTQGF